MHPWVSCQDCNSVIQERVHCLPSCLQIKGYIIDFRGAQICMIACVWLDRVVNQYCCTEADVAFKHQVVKGDSSIWRRGRSLSVTYSHTVQCNSSATVLWSVTLKWEFISHTWRVGGETGALTQARRKYTAGNQTQDLLAVRQSSYIKVVFVNPIWRFRLKWERGCTGCW